MREALTRTCELRRIEAMHDTNVNDGSCKAAAAFYNCNATAAKLDFRQNTHTVCRGNGSRLPTTLAILSVSARNSALASWSTCLGKTVSGPSYGIGSYLPHPMRLDAHLVEHHERAVPRLQPSGLDELENAPWCPHHQHRPVPPEGFVLPLGVCAADGMLRQVSLSYRQHALRHSEDLHGQFLAGSDHQHLDRVLMLPIGSQGLLMKPSIKCSLQSRQ